ncbi:MAG: PIG-L family deacetylase [Lentisphaerae bacterium]|nr:PIG-L family deacetylase [Lentisphaerota bacterium]
MTLSHATADCFVPDGAPVADALARTTHLGIGAHQDDVEFMAMHGILACFDGPSPHFGGVTCTNGAGSARVGPYAGVSNDDLCRVRRTEQRTAAQIGRYSFVAQLDFTSAEAKTPGCPDLVDDLAALLRAVRAQVVYTHNPADKHDTHVAVSLAVIAACRQLHPAQRPARVCGCEVWRNLDWLPDDEKIVLDVSARPNLQAALYGAYDSQIAGGKRYDLATLGRARANATLLESHAADTREMAAFALDLTPLIADGTRDPVDYVTASIRRFESDVRNRMAARMR